MLVAEEPPLLAVRDRARRVRTDVAAALAFGQEHPSFPRLVGVEAPEPAHELFAHRCRCVPLDDVGGARRHAEPAVDGGLGLAHEVRERGGEHRGDGAPGVRGQARESGADEVRLALEPRRVVFDPVRLHAPLVVARAARGRACR